MFPEIANILVSIALLVAGRKLFWVFVGAAGFVTDSSLATLLLAGTPEWAVLAVALVAGLVGVLIGFFRNAPSPDA